MIPSIARVDAFGFAASAMTLVAFAQRSMRPMRLAAISANVFFITYGALGPYYPVFALHLILLPLNLGRLLERVGPSNGTLVDLWREANDEVFRIK